MTKDLMISMLKQAKTGTDMLKVLDVIVADSVEYDYVESPMIESILGIVPTLEEIAF